MAAAPLACVSPPRQVSPPIAPSPMPAPAPTEAPAPTLSRIDTATGVVTVYDRRTVGPESPMRTAGGVVRVRAPFDVAYEVAKDFSAYRELNPDYIEQSTIVDKQGDATDVYVRVPTVLGDYVWAIARFHPVPAKEGVAYRADMVSGNAVDLRIYWRLVPRGPDEVVGQFELMANPDLPFPRAWVLDEVKDGVRIILENFRDKTERRARERATETP
jgi:hypothetical protein